MNFAELMLTYDARRGEMIERAIDRRDFARLKELTCGE